MGLLTLPLLLAIFVVTLLHFYLNYKERHSNFPPGPPRLPIYGSYWYLLKENYHFTHRAIENLAKKYKTELLGFYLGTFPTIVPVSYNMLKEVLTREEFIGRNDTFITRNRSLGQLLGLFFTDGPKWQEQRRFSLRCLRDFGFGRRFQESEDFMESETRELINFLSNDPDKTDSNISRSKGVALFPDIFYAPVLNSVLQILVGQKFDKQELLKLSHGTLRFMQSSDTTGNAISVTPWLKHIAPEYFGVPPLFEENQRLYDFFKGIVDERNGNFSSEGHFSHFLDVYLSKLRSVKDTKGSSFTEDQMIWVLIDVMFPSATAIPPSSAYMFAYLITYPDIQTKVREEIHRVVGKSRLPNLNDRQNLPYTEAFIKEVLRKQPVQPIGTPRRCVKDTTINGYFVPKDCFILPCQWTSNHDPSVWAEPYSFKPERFLDENGNLLNKDLSFTFGGGKRVCIPETFSRHVFFLFLTGLLQNFRFKHVDKMPEIENKTGGVVVCMADFWAEAILD